MRTLILATIIRFLIPLFLGFAVYMFFRGHDRPGGGFIAGLIASIPFMIYAMAYGSDETRRHFKLKPLFMASCGLLLAAGSGIFSMVEGKAFMTSIWLKQTFPLIGKVGTPIFFDLGVFLLVSGIVLEITFLLAEE